VDACAGHYAPIEVGACAVASHDGGIGHEVEVVMRNALFIVAAAAGATGCAADIEVTTTAERPTFEEFEAATYHEDFEHGVYVVNGDEPVEDVKALEEFWQSLYEDGALIVNRAGNADTKWNDTLKLNLTYCVSNGFSGNKARTVTAMAQATANWQAVANVRFVYVPAEDGNCTATNNNVVFNVAPTSGQSYLARAFFPNNSRSSRNVMVDSSAYGNLGDWTLAGVMTHELGHALGFRHEHTRPEAGQCFEDNSWRALTTYDSTSVMHYPQCGGTGPALTISTKDAQGAAALYGAPGGGTPPPPPPPPPPTGGGTAQTGTASGSVAKSQFAQFNAINVTAGSLFTVTMSGTGDPDLYVRFGAAPTTTQWTCRPYLDGATEQCSINVPAGQSAAYIGVRGYTAATYTLNVSWTGP